MAFRVGDLVRGIDYQYGVTNQDSICLVTKVEFDPIDGDYMHVRVVAHKNNSDLTNYSNTPFQVHNSPSYFEKITLAEYEENPIEYYAIDNMYDYIRTIRESEGYSETKNETEKTENKLVKVWEPDFERHRPEIFKTEQEEIDLYSNEIRELISKYGYDSSPYGRGQIVKTHLKNKTPIENLFSKSPEYNPITRQIVFTHEFDRKFDREKVMDFGNSLKDWFDKKIDQVEYRIDGKTYKEVEKERDIYEQIQVRMGTVKNIEHFDKTVFKHEDINGLVDLISKSKIVYENVSCKVSELEKVINKFHDSSSDFYKFYAGSVRLDDKTYATYIEIYKIVSTIYNLTSEKMSEYLVEEFNDAYLKLTNKKLNACMESKLSRLILKICKAIGVVDDPEFEWEKKFAKLSDAINPKKIPYKVVLSINPIDFYTMSFGVNYSSCHTIDKTNIRGIATHNSYHGCYSSGTESYMLDGTSFVYYTVDKKYESDFEKQGKVTRCIFNIGEDKLVMGRLYPQADEDMDSYNEVRELVLDKIRELINPKMKYVKEEVDRYEDIRSKGTHYKDYSEFSQCHVNYMVVEKTEGELEMPFNSIKLNHHTITIGHNPICPMCGNEHYESTNILCDDCVKESYEYYEED